MAGAILYEEEAQALDDVLKCIFGFTKVGAVRCVVELGIPDIVQNHPGGVTLAQLSSELGCSSAFLHRLMRFLTHHRIFKEVKMGTHDSPTAYAQTAFSRLLIQNNMAPLFLLMTSPDLMASMSNLSKFLVSEKNNGGAFEAAHGVDIWHYIVANPSFSDLYHKAMACRARSVVPNIIQNCMAAFEGIGCLVDVGGGNGTTLRAVVKACPWITRAINFDLPHVVSSGTEDGLVEHIGGDMFVAIPSADAALINSVLHDWDDDACLKILKNCKESIQETGKVMIVDVVIDDDGGNDKYREFHLGLDVEMMAHTIKGKERTSKEWADLLTSSGFSKYTIKDVPPLQSLIVAYP